MFTSFDTSMKHFPNTGRVVDQLEYPRVIGYLMYAMTCIRPNFIFLQLVKYKDYGIWYNG